MGAQKREPLKQTDRVGWRAPAILVLGVVLGVAGAMALAPRPVPQAAAAASPVLVRAHAVGLAHPIVSCTSAGAVSPNLSALQDEVTAILASARAKGLTHAGLHVADLETCESFEIGADERFHPASMLKLPIAMAWLRRLGTDPTALGQTLTYSVTQPIDPKEDPRSAFALQPGQSYTVEDLLKRMLIESRNDAKWLLGKYLPPEQFDAVWRDLGMSPPQMDRDVTLPAREIAMLFRALYNGTSLGPGASELALKWLTTATWRDGMMAQLPADAVVAHKYGRRGLRGGGLSADIAQRDASGQPLEVAPAAGEPAIQLADCGILYRPGHPMLVCLMTEGLNEDVLKDAIQRVARSVWSFQQL